MRLLLALALLAAAPASAGVYEVGEAGEWLRLDTVVERPVAAPRPATQSARARAFGPQIAAAAQAYEVSAALVDAIAHVESRHRADAVSSAGARGVMQLMPGTARDLGVDPRDPAANIRGGTAYLRQLLNRFDGDVVRTIAAYNAGPGAVLRAGGVPRYRETQAYVASVLERLSGAAQ